MLRVLAHTFSNEKNKEIRKWKIPYLVTWQVGRSPTLPSSSTPFTKRTPPLRLPRSESTTITFFRLTKSLHPLPSHGLIDASFRHPLPRDKTANLSIHLLPSSAQPSLAIVYRVTWYSSNVLAYHALISTSSSSSSTFSIVPFAPIAPFARHPTSPIYPPRSLLFWKKGKETNASNKRNLFLNQVKIACLDSYSRSSKRGMDWSSDNFTRSFIPRARSRKRSGSNSTNHWIIIQSVLVRSISISWKGNMKRQIAPGDFPFDFIEEEIEKRWIILIKNYTYKTL